MTIQSAILCTVIAATALSVQGVNAVAGWLKWQLSEVAALSAFDLGTALDCFRPFADNPRKRALLEGLSR